MLDATGFKRKRFADHFSEMEAKAKEAFGERVNTTERSPLGIILRLFAWFMAMISALAEDVYNSGYIPTAEGDSLSKLGPYVGIRRIGETYAIGEISIIGTAGYTVPLGFRGSTSSGTLFQTISAPTLDGIGAGTALIEALAPGIGGNVAASTITTIVNPNPNITSITNAAPTTGGREKETDGEFRNRFALSVAGGGAATLDSMTAGLLRTPGVRAATVIENYTNAPVNGLPAKSVAAYVLGGEAADIALTILKTKAGGIEPFGNQSATVKDMGGNDHIMKFSYAVQVPVSLRVTATIDNRYPADGNALIKSALIRLIGGQDANGVIYNGLSMGADVIHSRLIASAYIDGVTDVVMEISKDSGATWTQTNLTISAQEVAQTSAAAITVVKP
jgi:uncharacterized phage protein gp47/JayE